MFGKAGLVFFDLWAWAADVRGCFRASGLGLLLASLAFTSAVLTLFSSPSTWLERGVNSAWIAFYSFVLGVLLFLAAIVLCFALPFYVSPCKDSVYVRS